MNQELAVRKAEIRLEQQKMLKDSALEIIKNPVLEIVAGYLLLEWAQHQIVGASEQQTTTGWQWNPLVSPFPLPKITRQEEHHLIDNTAATVAEGGLLVAVCLQQGGKDVLMGLINTAGQTAGAALGLAGKALPALAGLAK